MLLFRQDLADFFKILTNFKMLRTFFFAHTAVKTVGKGLAAATEVVTHHLFGVIGKTVHVIIGPNFKNAGNVNFRRTRLTVLASRAVKFGELFDLFPREERYDHQGA